jgi:hypothetical protein
MNNKEAKFLKSNRYLKEGNHIFINVIERRYNPFFKIKLDLINSNTDYVFDLDLSSATLNKILNVEYSDKRRFRFLYYKSVFTEIKQKLQSLLSELNDKQVFVYLTDEGVWSEMLRSILKNIDTINVKTVMVQHGLHFIEEPPSNLKLRKFINKLTELIFGCPSYGYGYIGSNLDYYLVYSTSDRDYVKAKNSQSLAFSCPKLIKYDFIQEYKVEAKLVATDIGQESEKVIFAMEPLIPTSGVNCTEIEMYEKMSSLFTEISSITKSKILFRPHPAMNTSKAKRLISKLSYKDIIVFDCESSLNRVLSTVDFVLSIHSTVLFDAMLVGKVPIQIITPCDDRRLHTKLEILNINDLKRTIISEIFSKKTIYKYMKDVILSDDDVVWPIYKQGCSNE